MILLNVDSLCDSAPFDDDDDDDDDDGDDNDVEAEERGFQLVELKS